LTAISRIAVLSIPAKPGDRHQGVNECEPAGQVQAQVLEAWPCDFGRAGRAAFHPVGKATKQADNCGGKFSFDRWAEIFKDPMLAAIAGKLAHKAHVLQMPDESCRLKEAM